MVSLISLLVILVISVLVTKIASQALTHTGLSKEAAKFQARSAFTGVGYTTSESEKIVNHPVRRRIVLTLMLIGNVGVISAVASLILTFVGKDLTTKDTIIRAAIILVSLGALIKLSKSKWMENRIVKIINRALEKFSRVKVKDYVELLKLQDGYEITVLTIKEDDWMNGRTLGESNLRREGLNVLGIQRYDGTYLGTPDGDTKIVEQDQLMLYGRVESVRNLERRKKDRTGDEEHERAIAAQEEEKQKQKEKDREKSEGEGRSKG
jgi:K+/H+ antiporter YhaU regulatory subunit KhtT